MSFEFLEKQGKQKPQVKNFYSICRDKLLNGNNILHKIKIVINFLKNYRERYLNLRLLGKSGIQMLRIFLGHAGIVCIKQYI